MESIDRLREENAKLVKVLHEVESEAVDAYLGLQHDCELLSGELEDRFRKWWHEQCENDRLRELVRDWHALATGGADSLTDWNHEQADLERRMRELGVSDHD